MTELGQETKMPNSISVATLRELLAGPAPPIVLDVRRQQAFTDDPNIIPGALRRLPESVDSWAAELPPGCHVVAYCVHGHQVSQGVSAHLEQLGIDAHFLEGGIEQWKNDGGSTLKGSAGSE